MILGTIDITVDLAATVAAVAALVGAIGALGRKMTKLAKSVETNHGKTPGEHLEQISEVRETVGRIEQRLAGHDELLRLLVSAVSAVYERDIQYDNHTDSQSNDR